MDIVECEFVLIVWCPSCFLCVYMFVYVLLVFLCFSHQNLVNCQIQLHQTRFHNLHRLNISKTKGTMVSLCCCFQGGWNRFSFCWTFLLSGVEAWNVGEYLGQTGNCQRACLRDLCQNFQVPQISHFKILWIAVGCYLGVCMGIFTTIGRNVKSLLFSCLL